MLLNKRGETFVQYYDIVTWYVTSEGLKKTLSTMPYTIYAMCGFEEAIKKTIFFILKEITQLPPTKKKEEIKELVDSYAFIE